MKKLLLALPDELMQKLESEKTHLGLSSRQEVIRFVLNRYLTD